ncbi:hypothetical protein JKF63_03781 [Porcisia hertigi]|uniref:Calpain catalytic domain-containing protein n=1 Tax=Porcisia hertigi TaxID=2761500 RepID=A0A836HCE6_9TRYP|nr:hypothetical protein JKF63_03781 [Porcisia hertigi]
MESSFLDSVSRMGAAAQRHILGTPSAIHRPEAVVTPLKPGMLSPRQSRPRGPGLHGNRRSVSLVEVSSAAMAGLPAAPTNFTPKHGDTRTLSSRLRGCGRELVSVPTAVTASRGRRNQKLSPRSTRLREMEAAKWLQDDCTAEVLVLREACSRQQVSSNADPGAREVLSLSSPAFPGHLTPLGEDSASPWTLATGPQSVVTGASALPTGTAKVKRESAHAHLISRAAGKGALPPPAGATKDPPHFVEVPTKVDCTPLKAGWATAPSPLTLPPRRNVASLRRITPLDSEQGLEPAVRNDLVKTVAAQRQLDAKLDKNQGTTSQTVVSPSTRVDAPSPAQKRAQAAAITTVSPAPSVAKSLPASPPVTVGEHTQPAECQSRRHQRVPSGQRSVRFSEAPKATVLGAQDVQRNAVSHPDLRPKVTSRGVAVMPPLFVETPLSSEKQVSSAKNPMQGMRLRRGSLGSSTTTEKASDAVAPVASSTEEKYPAPVSPPRRRSLHSAQPLELSQLKVPLSKSTSRLVAAVTSPEERPETRQYPHTDTRNGSPVKRVATERLVAFVRSVSDPEVLHVIYDYLKEHQQAVPRYRRVTAACSELLGRKEEMLRDCFSTLADGCSRGSARRRAVLAPHSRGEPVPKPVDSPDVKALPVGVKGEPTEAQRLSQQFNGAGGHNNGAGDPDTDEFDDFNYLPTPYVSFARFSYGYPRVSGVVTSIFAEGMLFKIKTVKGEYHFYNDTLQEVMVVRVQCRLRGDEKINERATLAPIEDTGETEITIAVLPEETSFFMSGIAQKLHFLVKRVPVPHDYVSPSMTQSLRKINAGIDAVRAALGKWSRASDQQAYMKCCSKNRLSFTDLDFRPSAEGLYRPHVDVVAIPALTWRRPEEYVNLAELTQTRLFRGEISCFLVKQGELCNHTLVAAIAAVAQFPAHVRWMFRHPISAHVGKMERAQGGYRVTLLHNGWWHTYLIDDYVPASLKGPLFASCAEDPRRLWVQLLEKAYAKSLGSYAATCLVDAMEALGDLTGFPVRFVDSMWAAAAQKPNGNASRALFRYLDRSVRAGATVLLFSPPSTDEQSSPTVNMSRKRSSRMLPAMGTVPQFLPGHIYFLKDVAFYEELDLRMVRLLNPWTWETQNSRHYEKKWKYTTWYDHPDTSLSTIGFAATCANGEGGLQDMESRAVSPGARVDLSPVALALNERKGTMWLEWGEALAAFAGGGVCYTMWNRHRYRVKNAFVEGHPRLALELKARRKVELYITLSLETFSETLDSFGTVVASRPIPLQGTALSVVHVQANQSARVVSESCDDIECVAGSRTYVVARDVSMKVVVASSPNDKDATVLIVPLLDPSGVCGVAVEAGSQSASKVSPMLAAPEVQFVLSIVSDAAVGDGEDLAVQFVSLQRSCGVFTDPRKAFSLERTSQVNAPYQVCTDAGVITCEGSRICGNETKSI